MYLSGRILSTVRLPDSGTVSGARDSAVNATLVVP